MSVGFFVGCLAGALFGTTLGLFIGGLCSTAGKADDEAPTASEIRESDDRFPLFPSSPPPRGRVPDAPLKWKSVGPPPHHPYKGHSKSYYPLEN